MNNPMRALSYPDVARATLARVRRQEEPLERAAQIMGVVQAFGTGHSRAVTP